VSLETKRRLIERAVERRALVISVHAPYPGLGRLRAEGGKVRWEAVEEPQRGTEGSENTEAT